MDSNTKKVAMQQVATQLLAGMLSNPHIYATVSDEGGKGQQEQKLVLVALEMAERLIDQVHNQSDYL